MAERKAVNKYYPPDWDPSKQGSVNKRVGQHPLRDRARKLSQGILIIRFELPYNIWCDGCNNPVGMGVRYNAEKKKVGNYYSTPIYKFRMKCHLCDSHFEIQTDPKNHDYVVVSGARRKEQRWDPHQNEQIVPEDKATQKKLATDAMYKLEHGFDDQQKSKQARSGLGQIASRRGQWKDDYILNKLARNKFRAEKKAIQTRQDEDQNLLQKSSLDIALVDENEEDVHLAGLLKYRTIESFDERQKQKRKAIEQRPLFGEAGSSAAVASPLQNNSKISTEDKILEQKKQLGLVISAHSPRPFSEGLYKCPAQLSGQNSVLTPPHLVTLKKSIRSKTEEDTSDVEKTKVQNYGTSQVKNLSCQERGTEESLADKVESSIPQDAKLENKEHTIQDKQNNALYSLISQYCESDESGSD